MIHELTAEDKKIILIGTAHVSRESVALVESVIDDEKPDTVCVELCESRYQSLRSRDQWLNTDIVKVIKEKKAFLLLSHLLLASFQKRIARRLDIKPGEEMIRAIEAADRVGAQIHLADRDVRVTLSRTWRAMGVWDKLKLLFQLILSMGEADDISAEDVEKMKQEDVLTAVLADMGKSFPVISRIIIDERDQYLSQRIRQAPGNKIVAVVGAGHVEGIKKYWDVKTDLAPLEEIPPASKALGLIKWLLPLLIVGIFGFGFFYGGAKTGKDMLTWWVLANGILAGLGALLALGHPLTILTSVLAAPLTSLNPLIAAGWVSGLVEAVSRKPKVKDIESLQTDILSIKGFWRNKVTRILLVVVFTNLGSSIGTFVALPLMMRLI
ncbi:MAG: TraB family protein [Deltaproteobacteria bacterium]|nr:MAG: TraB family protein [Deltaproteobacteria bacterium]